MKLNLKCGYKYALITTPCQPSLFPKQQKLHYTLSLPNPIHVDIDKPITHITATVHNLMTPLLYMFYLFLKDNYNLPMIEEGRKTPTKPTPIFKDTPKFVFPTWIESSILPMLHVYSLKASSPNFSRYTTRSRFLHSSPPNVTLSHTAILSHNSIPFL